MKKNLKKLISTVAALAIAVSCVPAFAADFTDVADTADYKVAVDNIVALGIAQGNPDGTFAPENLIKRSEASKMIVGTMGPAMMSAAESSKGATGFSDVPAEHWASGYIVQGVSKGYINGMGDGTFAPDANVTFGQVVKMLVCVLGYGDDAENAGGWLGGGYLSKAASLGVSEGFDNYPADKAVNRGEVAMLINNSLDIPVKAIVDYDTGFELDADGNLKTVVVPVLKPMNGKNGYDYETLLTTYFNAYAVRGRINEKADKVEGTVQYRVEFSENFDGDKVEAYYNDSDELKGVVTEEVIYPEDLDVDSLLFSYTDAIIMENEDGDWELVSIASYGRNEVVTVSSELFDKYSADFKTIEFKRGLDTVKTNDYDLDANVEVWVNGEKVSATNRKAAIDTYVDGKYTTEVKLIDTPDVATKSVDGEVDYIMLSVFTSAVVSSVAVDESEAEIYIKAIDASILDTDTDIVIDFEDVEEGEQEYSIVDTEGNEVAVADLKKNDVITIYASVYAEDQYGAIVKGIDETSIEILVSTKTVEGQVSGKNTLDGITTYTVAGESFTRAHANVSESDLAVGNSYTFYVDAFGKFVMVDTLASSVNYGIINRAYESTTGDYIVRMVNTDGELVSYTAKDKAEFDKAEKLYKDSLNADGTPKAFADVYKNLVVTYKLNSKDQLHSVVKAAEISASIETDEFDAEDVELGGIELSDATKVVDVTKAKAAWNGSIGSLVSAGSADSFVDGVEYGVIAVGKEFTDGSTPFVIVVTGESAITATTAFAVVKSTGAGINEADGITYNTIVCLQDGEEKVLYTEKTHGLDTGDIFVYSLDNDGLADNFTKLYSVTNMALADLATEANYATVAPGTFEHETYLKLTGTPWADSAAETKKIARIGVGALVENKGSKLVIGKVAKVGDDYKTTVLDESKIDLADDANVYVYDLRKASSAQLSIGTEGNLVPTVVADINIDQTGANDVYKWNAAKGAKTVFYQTYEDEITNIIIVIPA